MLINSVTKLLVFKENLMLAVLRYRTCQHPPPRHIAEKPRLHGLRLRHARNS